MNHTPIQCNIFTQYNTISYKHFINHKFNSFRIRWMKNDMRVMLQAFINKTSSKQEVILKFLVSIKINLRTTTMLFVFVASFGFHSVCTRTHTCLHIYKHMCLPVYLFMHIFVSKRSCGLPSLIFAKLINIYLLRW